MLYYNKIDVSEGVDVNKTSISKDCDICQYWHFIDIIDKGFKFQPHVCNGCHDILMISMNPSNIKKLKKLP